ncbi:MAG: alpha/beta hydrolase [Vicinamibacterales bacterium]|nr:alpha/beta hydrolase [Vicinamibacterales bacterium]
MRHWTPVVTAALLCALFFTGATAQSSQRLERLITNGNTTIQVFVEGVGPTVVMLPSLGRGVEDCTTSPGTWSRDEHLAAVARVFFATGQNPAAWEHGWYRQTQESQGAANRATPVASWWAAGSAPVLVLQGTEDVIAPAENSQALMKELPEQPELIAKVIIDFLRR